MEVGQELMEIEKESSISADMVDMAEQAGQAAAPAWRPALPASDAVRCVGERQRVL